MYDMVMISKVISGGFICWLLGLGAGVTVRFLRNVITSASSN